MADWSHSRLAGGGVGRRGFAWALQPKKSTKSGFQVCKDPADVSLVMGPRAEAGET